MLCPGVTHRAASTQPVHLLQRALGKNTTLQGMRREAQSTSASVHQPCPTMPDSRCAQDPSRRLAWTRALGDRRLPKGQMAEGDAVTIKQSQAALSLPASTAHQHPGFPDLSNTAQGPSSERTPHHCCRQPRLISSDSHTAPGHQRCGHPEIQTDAGASLPQRQRCWDSDRPATCTVACVAQLDSPSYLLHTGNCEL